MKNEKRTVTTKIDGIELTRTYTFAKPESAREIIESHADGSETVTITVNKAGLLAVCSAALKSDIIDADNKARIALKSGDDSNSNKQAMAVGF